MLVYLIGFMGSGKTTQGRKLAEALSWDFIDTDEWLEKQENSSVNEIFKAKGEAYFRDLETYLIGQIATRKNTIIATGGGMPCFNQNLDLLKQSGLVIYLKAGLGCIMQRILNERDKRPLLSVIEPNELADFISDKLDERKPCYQNAHYTVLSKGLKIQALIDIVQQHYQLKSTK